jgi:hypothetical protein
MADVYVTEFGGVGSGVGDQYAIPAACAPKASNKVGISGSTTQSPVFNAETTLVRVFAEADCIVTIGVTPNAESGIQIPLAAAGEIYLVPTGAGQRLAVVGRTVS